MNKHFTNLAFVMLLILSKQIVLAQNSDTLNIERNPKGKIKFARFAVNENSNRRMHNDTAFLKTILQTKNEDNFKRVKEFTDELGITHRRFQQFYKGLKVENAEYLVHGKNNNITLINGDFQNINVSSVNPSINEADALRNALLYVDAKKYKWEDPAMEQFVKQNTNNPQATYFPHGELLISKDYLKGTNAFILSWKFTISSLEPNNEQLIYVNALNGEVINDVPLILDANIQCTAQTRYSGTQTITGDTYSGGVRLRENRNGVSIQTLNLNYTYNHTSSIDFSNNSTNWTSGDWSSFYQDQWALDAHWGAERVLDFWRTVFSRNSIDGNGLRVINYVHAGSNWANAQWVSGPNSNFMQYGDGNASFKPLTALDVCAHEFGHGITQFTASLTYNYEESGALNEGFSDIWAACVEHWTSPEKQTWLIGEEIFNSTQYNCIRNMQNPKSLDAAEGRHPNTYHGDYWDYNGEQHNNSTVLSHWFYLLSNGGNSTNDLGHSYSINGIGINNAQRIAFRAESMYLNSSASFSDTRNATIQAAIDLFGEYSVEEVNVTNAWYAVGIGNLYEYPNVNINGPTSVCSDPCTFVINNLPSGASVTWSTSNSNLTIISGQGSSSALFAISGSGLCQINALVSCSGNSFSPTPLTVSVGAPLRPYINNGSTTSTYSTVDYTLLMGQLTSSLQLFFIDQSSSATSSQWIVEKTAYPSNFTLVQNDNSVFVTPNSIGTGSFTVKGVNQCGESTTTRVNLSIRQSGGHGPIDPPELPLDFAISPNPATDQVSITVQDNGVRSASKGNSSSSKFEVQLWNATELIKLVKTEEGSVQFPLGGLASGTYYIRVIHNGKVKSKVFFKR